MKKVFFLFACLSVFAFNAQAQKACSKKSAACCASKAKMAQGAAASVDDAVIAKAASLDESIERKVCDMSGKVSYHMNYVCSDTGKMTSKPVMYDAGSARFVNVSPTDMSGTAAKKACCAGKSGKACAKGKKASLKAEAVESKSKALKVSTSSSMQ